MDFESIVKRMTRQDLKGDGKTCRSRQAMKTALLYEFEKRLTAYYPPKKCRMNMDNQNKMTIVIAVWGAAVGTLTFLWNLMKWRQERPRISASVEAVESFHTEKTFACIRLTIRNRGGKKTTLENIQLYRRPTWREFGFDSIIMRLSGQAACEHNIGVSNPKTVSLPAILDVNAMWKGFIPLEASNDDDSEQRQVQRNRYLVEALCQGGLRYSIQCSHSKVCLTGVIQQTEP